MQAQARLLALRALQQAGLGGLPGHEVTIGDPFWGSNGGTVHFVISPGLERRNCFLRTVELFFGRAIPWDLFATPICLLDPMVNVFACLNYWMRGDVTIWGVYNKRGRWSPIGISKVITVDESAAEWSIWLGIKVYWLLKGCF